MADGTFDVAVVTPEERLVDGRARSVVLRSSDGDLTVLDGHTPLVTDVMPGEVRIERDEGGTARLAVHGGYLQVEGGETRVTLLAGVAELAEQIDVGRAERAREEASAQVQASQGEETGEGRALAEAALRRAEVRLAVAAGS